MAAEEREFARVFVVGEGGAVGVKAGLGRAREVVGVLVAAAINCRAFGQGGVLVIIICALGYGTVDGSERVARGGDLEFRAGGAAGRGEAVEVEDARVRDRDFVGGRGRAALCDSFRRDSDLCRVGCQLFCRQIGFVVLRLEVDARDGEGRSHVAIDVFAVAVRVIEAFRSLGFTTLHHAHAGVGVVVAGGFGEGSSAVVGAARQ